MRKLVFAAAVIVFVAHPAVAQLVVTERDHKAEDALKEFHARQNALIAAAKARSEASIQRQKELTAKDAAEQRARQANGGSLCEDGGHTCASRR